MELRSRTLESNYVKPSEHLKEFSTIQNFLKLNTSICTSFFCRRLISSLPHKRIKVKVVKVWAVFILSFLLSFFWTNSKWIFRIFTFHFPIVCELAAIKKLFSFFTFLVFRNTISYYVDRNKLKSQSMMELRINLNRDLLENNWIANADEEHEL